MANKFPSRITTKLGYDLVALFMLTGVLIGIIWFYGARLFIIPSSLLPTLCALLVVIGLVVPLKRVSWLRANKSAGIQPQFFISREIKQTFRDWIPFVFILFIYENLRLYTGIIRPVPLDETLAAIDLAIFGVQPTVWIQQYTHPVLTEFMGLSYDLIFLLPLSLLVMLAALGKREKFRELSFALVICFIVGFILYLIFPAGPPRFYLEAFNTMSPLTGFLGYYDTTKELWDMANQMIVHSSFPSMHIALSVVTLRYAFRYEFWPASWFMIRPVYLFLVSSLWVSTIYLRHHWTPDIVSGCLLGLVSAVIARSVTNYSQKPVKIR